MNIRNVAKRAPEGNNNNKLTIANNMVNKAKIISRVTNMIFVSFFLFVCFFCGCFPFFFFFFKIIEFFHFS